MKVKNNPFHHLCTDYLPFILIFFFFIFFRGQYGKIEPYLETASYYEFARLEPALQFLTNTWLGYWALFLRIFSYILSHWIPPYWVGSVFNLIPLVFISAACSGFVLPQFRSLVKSDMTRAIISIGLVFYPNYEVNSFIYFEYYCAGFYLLTLFLCFEKLELSAAAEWTLGILVGCLALTKGLFLSFFAPWAFAYFWCKKHHSKSGLKIATLALVGQFIQITYILFKIFLQGNHVPHSTETAPLNNSWNPDQLIFTCFSILVKSIYGATLENIFHTRLDPLPTQWWKIGTSYILPILGLMTIVFGILRAKRLQLIKTVTWIQAALTFTILVSVIVLRWYFGLRSGLDWKLNEGSPANPYQSIGQICLYLWLGLFVSRCSVGLGPAKKNLMMVLFLFASSLFCPRMISPLAFPYIQADWKAFAPLIADAQVNHNNHCIPFNPFPAIIQIRGNTDMEDCTYLSWWNRKLDNLEFKDISSRIRAPWLAETHFVELVGFLFENNGQHGALPLHLVAYNSTGDPIGTGILLTPTLGGMSYYQFSPKIKGIGWIQFTNISGQMTPLSVDRTSGMPLWLWLGYGRDLTETFAKILTQPNQNRDIIDWTPPPPSLL